MGKREYVKITLTWICECGYSQLLDWYDHKTVSFRPAYTSESGTGWPSELEITCPACGGVDELVF